MKPSAVGPGAGRARPPLVIAGIPRSGTTWTLGALACDPSLDPLKEPDSEADRASAIWAKRATGRFPALIPGEANDPYRQLWAWILDGAPASPRQAVGGQILRAVSPPPWDSPSRVRSLLSRARRRYLRGGRSVPMWAAGTIAGRPRSPSGRRSDGRRPLVKTVHAPLALDWLGHQFDMDVLVLRRHPGSVLASWIALDLDAQYVPFADVAAIRRTADAWGVPPPGPDHLSRMVWQIGLLLCGLERAVAHHPTWTVRTHEQLCGDPVREFHALYDDLGLLWNERAVAFLEDNNRPGRGFRTRRVAADLPGDWKRRLTRQQMDAMHRVLSTFPSSAWLAHDLGVAVD